MDFSFQKGIIRSSRGIFQASAQSGPSSLLGGPTLGRSAGRAASGPQINRLTPRVRGTLSRRVFEPAREIARPPHTERSGDGCLSLYQRICKAQTDLSNELWWVGVSLSLPNFNFASMGVAERRRREGGGASLSRATYLQVLFILLHLSAGQNIDHQEGLRAVTVRF